MSSFFLEAASSRTNKYIFKGAKTSDSLQGTPSPTPRSARPSHTPLGLIAPSGAVPPSWASRDGRHPGVRRPPSWEAPLGLVSRSPCSSRRFMQHPKNFGLIASFLERKVSSTTSPTAPRSPPRPSGALSSGSRWVQSQGPSLCQRGLSLLAPFSVCQSFPPSSLPLLGEAAPGPAPASRPEGAELQARKPQESCTRLPWSQLPALQPVSPRLDIGSGGHVPPVSR